jgi:hypothetical protein
MRLRPDEDRRLDALAEITQRTRSDVIRLLIRTASITAHGGIALPESPTPREEAREPATSTA